MTCGKPFHLENGDVEDCTDALPCRKCLLNQVEARKEQVASLQRVLAHRRDMDSEVDG